MLSFIAKLYDPLCIVGPTIVTAKVFMQKLWLLGLSWDAVVPDKEKNEFENFIRNLQNIEHLNIPRCIIQRNNTLVEIHGFSDSSEQAYDACVYVRCKDCFGNFSVHLLCSKSRVAPVKCVTLPRLELLGAVLLSTFVNKVLEREREAMQMTIDTVHLYTDSTIVLSWIRTQPHRLKCFVANRVMQTTDLTNTFEWHHINSKDNPADPLSRGLSVDDLNRNNNWWCGSNFLHRDVDFLNNWDCSNTDPGYMKELKPIMNTFVQSTVPAEATKKNVDDIFLTSRELNHARDVLVRQAQTREFNAELKALILGNNIPPQTEVENFEVLTPGHFLIGRALNAIVEPDLCSVNTNKLDKYRKITKIVQNIWKSWKKDYLNNLQARSKWQFDQSNVKINTVVLLKEDNFPIAHWIIGKIVQTYPGTDGKIRVIQLKLANDNFVKRPISKIAILPIV
ncbi:reverse transcriptase domain-containing protein [Trichonephila clavipes]|uniref:Reverse transcriptase domain-containing protein n=1 Tax=Trichonephila clavipes TaxID=2585209 RepID=A0A8X6RUV2_TRICX|nr:reverse transcriptase domain-containing protein [Trichonephila clavipes]